MSYLVSFDIDNTLIKSSAGHVESLILAIKDTYSLKTSINVINHHGMTDQEIIIKILRKHEVDDKVIRSKLKKCIDHMQLQYAQIVQSENIVILEGVFNLLSKLDQKGFLLGLVTGNLESIARAKLKKIVNRRKLSAKPRKMRSAYGRKLRRSVGRRRKKKSETKQSKRT